MGKITIMLVGCYITGVLVVLFLMCVKGGAERVAFK